MTIKDLLFKAGGFDDPQFRAEIFLKEQTYIVLMMTESQKLSYH